MTPPRFLLAASFVLALAFIFSCSSDSSDDPDITYGTLPYGGKSYRTVKIGNQTWMAENLNHAVAGSKCYGEDGEVYVDWDEETDEDIYSAISATEVQANCATYGRLYNWATAMDLPSSCNSSTCASQVQSKHRGICPEGWHIPSDDDWTTLTNYVENQGGCSNCSGTRLKATSGWNRGGNGTDNHGFSALPGGYGDSDSYFVNVGYDSDWWSSTESNILYAYDRYMYYEDSDMGRGNYNKTDLFSVRCVKD